MDKHNRTANCMNKLSKVLDEAGLFEFSSELALVYFTLEQEAGVPIRKIEACDEVTSSFYNQE